jgi:hypothetical protein
MPSRRNHPRSILLAHEVERASHHQRLTRSHCSDLELENYLKNYPDSALALLYGDFDLPAGTPQETMDLANLVTILLTKNEILDPYTTLEALNAHLESVMPR